MAEQTQELQENGENIVNRVFGVAHKTLIVGLGAVGMAQDGLKKSWEGGNEFAGKLVERGETISNERRQQIDNRVEKRQEQVKDLRGDLNQKVGDSYNQATNAALNRMNVPSRTDIQDLSKQINALNRKVDKVRKEQQERAVA
ncbi:MAG: phasin family protein [Anaerolineaceae bacterium]|nr:MAG: phasin family protein [Anaerolineaceae bacterium]